MELAKEVLKNIFGYDEFRPMQREIIDHLMQKKDALVIMPTGGGKSLCYQLPALLFKGMTLVVSPLISLMKDQMEQLRELGIDAVCLNSALSPQEYWRTVDKIRTGQARLLYLAPETLLKDKTLDLLADIPVDCLTIDEAHCISEWGHDFRPEYREIIKIRSRFPAAVCVALTATATPRVQKDIQDTLNFQSSQSFIGSFDRHNLFIQVENKNNPQRQLLDFIRRFPDQSGIIYCFSRKQVDTLYQFLKKNKFSVRPYHAGLSDKERLSSQELFIRDDIQIMVATIAFGMGINKPNVRFVVHYDLPKNIETYYQEIGRAGRDGLPAHCLLLFSQADISKVKFFIEQKEEQEKRIANIHLNDLLRFVETDVCRRVPLLNYFGENFPADCKNCDNCLKPAQAREDVTEYARMFLSAVRKTGQVFGATHIIDILRGSKVKKVLDFRHDQLPVYGSGQGLSKKQWFHLFRQFIQQGLLVQELEHGSLKITATAYELFRQKEKIMGVIQKEIPLAGKEKKKEKIKLEPADYDRELFIRLRQKRKELADRSRLPPYVIFPDRSLMEMAASLPRVPEDLLAIHGVGDHKCRKYGPVFLDLIRDYLDSAGQGQKTD